MAQRRAGAGTVNHAGMLRYWLDTEFMESGRYGIELLSIGVVCEDGREYYAENRYADLSQANPWVAEHVIPHLAISKGDKQAAGGKTPDEIRDGLLAFVNEGGRPPEFWAYFADYDWVVLCQLFGRMVDLPKGWPQLCLDLKQEMIRLGVKREELPHPEGFGPAHNALNDARWCRAAWHVLATIEHSRASRTLSSSMLHSKEDR